MHIVKAGAIVALGAALAACGGGGGDAPPRVASTHSFDFGAAYQQQLQSGLQQPLNLENESRCGGSATVTDTPLGPPVPFAGDSLQPLTSTLALNLTGACSTLNSLGASERYLYTADFKLEGHDSTGSYSVYAPPVTLPGVVKVGDAGPLASTPVYTDNTQAQRSGTEALRYEVEADTATSVLVNLTQTTTLDLLPSLPIAIMRQYRLDTAGHLTLASLNFTVQGKTVKFKAP